LPAAASRSGRAAASARLSVPQALGDLGFDVEGRLAARGPARVAGLDELPHLGRQLAVGRGRGHERVQLRLDVDRRLAARGASALRASSKARISSSRATGAAARSAPGTGPSLPIRSYKPELVASAITAASSASTETPITTGRNAASIAGQ